MNYFQWAENKGAGQRVVPLDVIELPDFLVLEGDAAEDTIRRHMTDEQRAVLEAAQGAG